VTPKQLDELADAYAHPVSSSAVVRAAKRAAVVRTLRLARRCLGFSDWTRRSLVADYGVDEMRTAVVPPPVDASAWDVKRSAPDPSRPFRLVFVGGHFERKGGRLLLDVYRERLRSLCELTIVTREELAAEPGVRVLRGVLAGSNELRETLRDADAFVLPTFADCHSIASLEAMAAGLPVVLTRIGAATDIVEHGQSGLLVRPRDGRELGDAVAELVADRVRARAMGARGRAIVAERFDAPKVAAQIFDHLVHAAREPR
jgi:glycosyltransferase involved in cell wall biosynthesis